MNEVEVSGVEQQTASQGVSASAGQMLRQAREARQMSIQTLASALKVPVAKLQALEEDRWDVLNDAVFTRAVAQSICRYLQMDSQEVLALLPKAGASKLASNPEGINTPFKEKTLRSSMSSGADSGRGKVIKLLAVLAIVVVGGVGLYVVPRWQQPEEVVVQSDVGRPVEVLAVENGVSVLPQPAVVEANKPVSATTVALMQQALPDTPSLAAAPAAPVSQSSTAAEAKTVAATAASETAAAVVPAASGTDAAESAAPVQAVKPELTPVVAAESGTPKAGTGTAPTLRLKASGQTWVQVRDASQRVVMEKILQPGDVYETTAERPLFVVLGNASASSVEVDGAPFDVTTLSKNNVARFEVK